MKSNTAKNVIQFPNPRKNDITVISPNLGNNTEWKRDVFRYFETDLQNHGIFSGDYLIFEPAKQHDLELGDIGVKEGFTAEVYYGQKIKNLIGVVVSFQREIR